MPETADTGLIARTETRDLGEARRAGDRVRSTARSPGRRGTPPAPAAATGAGTG